MKPSNIKKIIYGWLPKTPRNPKQLTKIDFEMNPIKVRQTSGKSKIMLFQVILIFLAVGFILSGLYLNSIVNERTSYSLPLSWDSWNTPFQFNGTNYNCSINIFISPPLIGGGIGIANMMEPMDVYLNEPCNLTSGAYCVTLRYAAYNSSENTYNPEQTNYTGVFSPTYTIKQDLVIHTVPINPPFQDGLSSDQEPIIRDLVLSFYCNSTGKLPPSTFTVTTPINLSQSSFIDTYPYRNQGTLLLAIGILSLLVVLVTSLVNLNKKPEQLMNQQNVNS